MTMYALKPIVSLPGTLHHTKTMYEMRNIQEERSTDDDHTEAESKIVPDITEQVISFLKVFIISVILTNRRTRTAVLNVNQNGFTHAFVVHGGFEPFLCLGLVVHGLLPKFPQALITIDREYGSTGLIDACPSNFSSNRTPRGYRTQKIAREGYARTRR